MASETPSEAASISPDGTRILPEIHLLCIHEKFSDAFSAAVQKYYPPLNSKTKISVHNCSLKQLPEDVRFDAVVSPANSYGRLDGSFDDALAKAYGPRGDYGWITRKAQDVLYEDWRGFAPPGTCTMVPLAREDGSELPWGTSYLLLCPTMRIPSAIRWDREMVYECIWSLLCAVDNHNRQFEKDSTYAGVEHRRTKIKSLLMTPLGTGAGSLSATRWAEQCVLAMKHWVEAVENPEVWSRLQWDKILTDADEVSETWRDKI